jgi:hypothetical protein
MVVLRDVDGRAFNGQVRGRCIHRDPRHTLPPLAITASSHHTTATIATITTTTNITIDTISR